jgi:hypothetical protein
MGPLNKEGNKIVFDNHTNINTKDEMKFFFCCI